LTVDTSGSGTVTCDTGSGFGACAATYPHGEFITLKAGPALHNEFSGWSGDCSGVALTCELELTGDAEVTATFAPIMRKLTVSKVGTGSVTCAGGPCAGEYLDGTKIKLAATPASGFSFSGWSGACTGTGGCELTLDADKALTATFLADPVVTPPVVTPPFVPPVAEQPVKKPF
jgi:hypothetical protein